MKKILIYGDVDLNLIDGSSVWLVNLARLLSMDEEIMVDILLKKRIRNERLVVNCAAVIGSACCM